MNDFTFVSDVLGIEHPMLRLIGAISMWALPITGFVSVVGLVSIWLERKISAHIQCRVGPMEVGPHGVLQTLADGIKLLGKEDLVPAAADRFLFAAAPMIVFASTFVAFATMPFSEQGIIADLNVGVFFIAATGSLEAIGVVFAGWSSNNKWSLFGAIRAATQVVSYEIPLGLSVLTMVTLAGSMSLIDMTHGQAGWFSNWFAFRNPFTFASFLIFFTAGLAECKRSPFDLPEAESELVSGFHTEYSGMRFAIFFLAEYGAMYLISALGIVMYFGGWYSGIPFLDGFGGVVGNLIGAAVMISKSFVLIMIMMWIRWTLPRIRLDQMMDLCLKYLLPFSLGILVISSLWQGLFPMALEDGKPAETSLFGFLMIAALGFGFVKMRKMAQGVLESEEVRTTLPIKKVGTA